MYDAVIVAADRSTARIYRLDDCGSLAVIADLAHPDTRERVRDREKRPRTQDRIGSHRHVIEPHESPIEADRRRFAATIASHLATLRRDGRLRRLVMIAPPRFLGALRVALPDSLRQCVVHEIAKDLVSRRPEDIVDRLPRHMPATARTIR